MLPFPLSYPEPDDRERSVIDALEAIRARYPEDAARLPTPANGLLDDLVPAGSVADASRRGQAVAEAMIGDFRDALAATLSAAVAPGFRFSVPFLTDLQARIAGSDPDAGPGALRQEPVRIVDRKTGAVQIIGTDPADVPATLEAVVEAANTRTGSCFVNAALVHLDVISIHGFMGGNGRLSRVLHAAVLARAGIANPLFADLESYVDTALGDYYAVLQYVNTAEPGDVPLRLKRWIRYCLTGHLRVFEVASRLLRLRDAMHEAAEGLGIASADVAPAVWALVRGAPADASALPADRRDDILARCAGAGLFLPQTGAEGCLAPGPAMGDLAKSLGVFDPMPTPFPD